MLNLQNKLIFFKFKNDSLGKLYYCINDIVLHIYNLDGSNRDFRHINNLNLIRDQIEIIDYDVALSILGNDFNIAYNLYNNRDSNNNEKLELKKRRLYRILDEKDIEFMETEIYKKYPLLFNLTLGIKCLEYVDSDNNYYFSRINPLKSIPEYEFVKFSEEIVFSRAIKTDCKYEHKISSYALDLLLDDNEKDFVRNFFRSQHQNINYSVGQFYRYIELEDIKERKTIYYKNNTQLYESILGVFVISFIKENSLLLSKLDYYQFQCPFDFHFELSFDDFNKMNFELLPDMCEERLHNVIKKLRLRKDLHFIPKYLL